AVANLCLGRHLGGPLADRLAANRRRHVPTVDEDRLVVVWPSLEANVEAPGELAEPRPLVGFDAVLASEEPNDPVHCTRVDVDVAEPLRELASYRALSRPSGPVDGDDQTLRPRSEEHTSELQSR